MAKKKKLDVIVNVDNLCTIKIKVMDVLIKEELTTYESKIVLSEILKDYRTDTHRQMIKKLLKNKSK